MRNYERKTERAITPQNVIKNAVDAVLLEGKSIRKTAKDFNIPEKSLSQYCKKQHYHGQQISGYTYIIYKNYVSVFFTKRVLNGFEEHISYTL